MKLSKYLNPSLARKLLNAKEFKLHTFPNLLRLSASPNCKL